MSTTRGPPGPPKARGAIRRKKQLEKRVRKMMRQYLLCKAWTHTGLIHKISTRLPNVRNVRSCQMFNICLKTLTKIKPMRVSIRGTTYLYLKKKADPPLDPSLEKDKGELINVQVPSP